MKRKILGAVLVLMFIIQAVGFAEESTDKIQFKDYYKKEIDPKDIFNKEKLTRTIIIDGKEYEDVIVVTKSVVNAGKEFSAESWGILYKMPLNQGELNITFEEDVENGLKAGARGMVMSYPAYEIVSINGVPWQKTKYADLIKREMEKYTGWGHQSDSLVAHPEYFEIVYDPRFNGLGYELLVEKRSREEVLKQAERLRKGLPIDWAAKSVEEGSHQKSQVEFNIQNGVVLKIGKGKVDVYRNGNKIKEITMNVAPKIVKNTTVIPLRGVFDQFGADLRYDGKTRRVTVETEDTTIILTLDSDRALVNGKEVKLSTPAFVENGRTLIPLRFVGENLGYEIKWFGEERKVVIQK